MTRTEKTRAAMWGLILTGLCVLAVASSYGHRARSILLATLGVAILALAAGIDVWDRSSPDRSRTVPALKHSAARTILFLATMAGLTVALAYLIYFEPAGSWKDDIRALAFSIMLFVAYNLPIAAVRHFRVKKQNSPNDGLGLGTK